jgi:dTDP-4-amino-4,6-dideoxygalactose transaminase
MSVITVMRPMLPSAQRLLPYLLKIDTSKIYSNHGPLALAFEERLAAHFGLQDGTVSMVANATLGLALALAAQGVRPGTLCVIPAWTFVASAHAALVAGLIPYFVDVDPETWALDVDEVARKIAHAPSPVGAVMPVVPFGRPIDVAAWGRFRSGTGVPVVIDAAAGFDAVKPADVPVVVSLHATKIFGVGEGGFVMSADTSLGRDIHMRANFGFWGSRDAIVPAVNAKLSEYHAAVGLAALDEWSSTRNEWMAVARAYRNAIPESDKVRFQDGFGQSWIASTCNLYMRKTSASHIESTFRAVEIDTRRWWGEGAHMHPATAAFPRSSLPTTEMLAHSTIGLPFSRDLTPTEIGRIAEAVISA